MTEKRIDLPNLKAKALAAYELGCMDDFRGVQNTYREASKPSTILTLIGALEELAEWRRDLLECAVVCEDGDGFVKSLIEEAKLEGITMDGRTLVAAD